jgi:hypothetical protein
VREYRRGLKMGVWQKLWHFHADCPSFPVRNFEAQRIKPLDENLCSRCATLGAPNRR